jgi:anaerobic selenocysteine-containing dehydrogenase
MSQMVAARAGAAFNGFGEARVPFGRLTFSDFRNRVRADCIKTVFWFGGLYPYSYPELMPEATKVRFSVVSSIFRPDVSIPGLVLPVASELEKESVGESYWGEVSRNSVAEPPSGARPVAAILNELTEVRAESPAPAPRMTESQALKAAIDAMDGLKPVSSDFVLVGEKRAIGIGGFYEPEEQVSISPAEVTRLGLSRTDNLLVESGAGSVQFQVKPTSAVPPGVLAVGVNAHRNRALFPLAGDPFSGVSIPPAAVRVTKVPAAERSPAENIARVE